MLLCFFVFDHVLHFFCFFFGPHSRLFLVLVWTRCCSLTLFGLLWIRSSFLKFVLDHALIFGIFWTTHSSFPVFPAFWTRCTFFTTWSFLAFFLMRSSFSDFDCSFLPGALFYIFVFRTFLIKRFFGKKTMKR